MLEVYVNDELIHINQSIKLVLDKIVSEYKNPTKLTGSYSYDFTIPLTNHNNRIFNNILDFQTVSKFKNTYKITVLSNEVLVIDGEFINLIVSRFPAPTLKGNIVGTSNTRLGDIVQDKKLRELTTFTKIDFDGLPSITSIISDTEYYVEDTNEVAFTFIPESFSHLKGLPKYRYTDFGLGHFVAGVVNKIFTELDYTVSGEIFNSEYFKRLFIPFSNSSGEAIKYNYGKLNPFQAELNNNVISGFNASITASTRIDRDNDFIYVVEPSFEAVIGDLSGSLVNGTYTCKYSGIYTFGFNTSVNIASFGAPISTANSFTVFRCIDNNEFLTDNQLPYANSFNQAGASNYVTELDTFHIGTGSFQARLIKGNQYRIQQYVSVPKTVTDPTFYYGFSGNSFNCNACDGKQLINPADFLPDLTQKQFLLDIFKSNNLYYKIDDDVKEITIFTRDEFFSLNKDNIINIDNYVSINSFEDSAITEKEISDMLYKYTEDENDYISKHTNYLELVGNLTYKDSSPLSYTPLAFLKVKLLDSLNNVIGYTNVPAIIADSDSDTSTLVDEKSISFAYSPRICLYHGNKVYKDKLKEDVINPLAISFTTFESYYAGIPPFGSYTSPTADNYTYLPVLSFFNPSKQPAYEVIENIQRRDFKLELTDNETLFELDNRIYLNPYINSYSLDLISGKSVFQQLYQNDIRINNYSNYSTGTIKMNASLFNKLNGRNIIQIDNERYLLESIKGFQTETESAKIRVYRIM